MATKAKATLKISELSATFPGPNGGLHVLDNISFEVGASEFVCVLGPSGSGKSTLLRILGGLLPATNGRVDLDGKRVREPRRGVGMVFQNANLMPWRTVLANISLPLELQNLPTAQTQARARELVDLVGLTGFEDTLPVNLSGGMAQRVAIARALVHDPEVLLLDEPFGALDAITRERMGEELLRIWRVRSTTVLMVTHDISEALFLADRVLVLSDRPAKLKLDLRVDLRRPRKTEMRYTRKFGQLARQLRDSIE
ncbi:MAG: ABC transporter ATP-binding protein [Chloroflexi bacterium]|nr:ABC transporter ATP-binding protein [Chloroflexota bacterium]